jgi:hypothetical protein
MRADHLSCTGSASKRDHLAHLSPTHDSDTGSVRQQVRPGKHFVVRCGLDGEISEGEVFRLVFVRGAVVCLMECW